MSKKKDLRLVLFSRISSVVTIMFVFLGIFPFILFAQDDTPYSTRINHLGFFSSIGLSSVREDNLVSLSFNGPCISLGPVYTRQSEKNLLHLNFNIGIGYLENRYSHIAFNLPVEFRSSWLKRAYQNPKYGDFWVGASIPVQMNDFYFDSWDDAHLYWITNYSLGPSFEWQKKLFTKINGAMRLEFPLLNLVSRPPKYRNNKQDAMHKITFLFSKPHSSFKFETLNNFQALFMQFIFRKEMEKSLWDLGLDFKINHCAVPEHAWWMNTAVYFSYKWRVGK